jgi:mono/diheme cytochrome c family protein
MAVGVLVVFWVSVGLAVLLVAMSATRRRRPAAAASARQSKASRRLSAFTFAAIFAGLGIAVPAAVMITNSDADANARGGVDLTASQVHGRQLFARNCSTCHTLAASNAVGMVGPNLDNLRPNTALVLNALEQGRARGQGQMPAQLLTGGDARDVAAYIAAVAGR